ncbi:FliM/FliN family flagellar motor switch protein [Pseudomonas typographi]|uniref:FliM/FliN family flagellar motor switch protein n=1 Tax=Pseudomonas typographi TaxID=2715964 RepID=UPI00168475FB|nr:FliM/FliN family flagellar motor switch protein [Pseudomonas typographi]MBD1589576.1 hypothetical protein [Pseudomonas typographi]
MSTLDPAAEADLQAPAAEPAAAPQALGADHEPGVPEGDAEDVEHSESAEYLEAPEEPMQGPFEAQPAHVLDAVAHLPLDLTLRCGHLTLKLGELRRLSAGTVLEVHGVTPGCATLCHGERVVAEGELVDVDGRLGLQITRTAPLP